MGVTAEVIEAGPLNIGPIQKRVIGVDLDDTLFWREIGIRYFGHAKNILLRPSSPSKTLDEIPHYDHTPYDLKSSLTEIISRGWHSRRTVIPGFAQMIRDELKNETEVYGITGRRASKAWMEMTEAQLMEANIKLTGIRMTPKGVSGLLSKADSIRELGITDFYEDDRRSVLYLAKLFPHVKFNYIDHGLAHLTDKDLAGIENITVRPIAEFCPFETDDGSAVRNSRLREIIDFVDPAIESLQERKPFSKIKAWQVTAAGAAFSIAGIELAEHQNRTGRYSRKTTALAVTSSVIGATLDLIDGKWARVIRSKMIDDEVKARDEEIGQAEDPFADGFVEAWQAGSAWYTSRKKGDRFGSKMALLRLTTTNLPRTAKAIAGIFGFKLPETYSFRNLLAGDIRILGVSLGRKIPNYAGTLRNSARGIPLQGIEDIAAVSANCIVAAERLGSLLTPKGEHELSEKGEKHALIRALILGGESLAFIGAAYFIGKMFSPKKK